jgi:spore maturation protein A
MLNYIWLALIVIGLAVAVSTDWHDLSTNRYANGEELQGVIHFPAPPPGPLRPGDQYLVSVEFAPRPFDQGNGTDIRTPLKQRAALIAGERNAGALTLTLDDQTPALWKERASALKKENLLARVTLGSLSGSDLPCTIVIEPVRFVKLTAVTNDGIIKYAKTAVELAIGLIGIMALWLGIMKVAEQAGLVALLAKVLRPITTRVFPDVPPDHPAMGAMIMNISANMLGLSNASTPFGLKAMEELNKLNPKAGTATDAMCTFLVINTANVQLIPATVIAIRAASGSSNPAEILGPVLIATFITLIVGVTIVKALARIPAFRRQLEKS